jgi:hypothetical protein
MTVLRVIHTPGGDESKAVTWDIEYADLTVAEVIRLEELCDKFEPQITASIALGSKADTLNLLYVWRQRTEPDLMWVSIEEMKAHDLQIFNPDPADEATPQKSHPTLRRIRRTRTEVRARVVLAADGDSVRPAPGRDCSADSRPDAYVPPLDRDAQRPGEGRCRGHRMTEVAHA